MLRVHSSLAKVGNLVMQIAVFSGSFTQDVIIAQGILLVDGHGFALLDLLGQDGIGL